MSMNINIEAEAEVVFVKTKKSMTVYRKFSCFQTPTVDSYKIINSAYPISAYIDWVKGRTEDPLTENTLYADDDYMCEYPIGTEIVDVAKQHIEELEQWLANCQTDGYEVRLYVQ